MQRMQLVMGTQAEILAELDQLGKDAVQAGKTEKADLYAEAWREIRDGDSVATVLRARYEIHEVTD